MSRINHRLRLSAIVLAMATTAAAAPAPSPQRTALFEAMQAAPADLDLMFAFATLSMQEGDTEAAIATLERMLIFNPDLPRVKLELGAAYFRLGAWDAARFYFEDALRSDPPEEVRTQVTAFLAQIDRRSAPQQWSGFVSLGPVWSSNANLGPQDREIRVATFPGGVGTLDPSAEPADSFGIRLGAGLTHVLDLGRPNEDAWITSLGYGGIRYFSESTGDYDVVDLATGPRLSLDGEQFGATVRPTLLAGFVRADDSPLYAYGGAGLELTRPLGPTLTAFGSLIGTWRSFDDDDADFDGFYGQISAGLAHALDEQTTLRGAAFLETDRTDADWNANVEAGLRVSVTRAVALPGVEDVLAGPLSLSGFGQVSRRVFDEADPAVDPGTTRRDTDWRLGARLYAPVTARSGVALDAGWFERVSNLPNYDLDNIEVGISYVFSF